MVHRSLKMQTQDVCRWVELGIDSSSVCSLQSGNIKRGRGWQKILEVELVVNVSTIQNQMFLKKQNMSDVCGLDSASLQPLQGNH